MGGAVGGTIKGVVVGVPSLLRGCVSEPLRSLASLLDETASFIKSTPGDILGPEVPAAESNGASGGGLGAGERANALGGVATSDAAAKGSGSGREQEGSGDGEGEEREGAAGAVSHMRRGLESLHREVGEGMGGLVRNPVEGVRQEGLPGLVRGGSRGIVNAVCVCVYSCVRACVRAHRVCVCVCVYVCANV